MQTNKRAAAPSTEQPGNEAGNYTPLTPKEILGSQLLDRVEIMELLKISKGTYHNWCNQGILVYSKIAGRKYFAIADLQAMIEKGKKIGRANVRAKSKGKDKGL